ncbi:2-hydroxyacid dehydrogenase [Alkalilimnicola ehrlichii MLHE-1]|uniref:D-isomer specific 2-hydroxyacid dehydrogenase, NAD-binding protein n=1 Tax=Alkalilimnicola ehrlichii (strain ATCC BAA-1101 / DSM 17681 / MLHE-1) TaxID=187272 RepID=Q0A8T8_ALKEH|nr:2-hydroxyacid dehydrogenase [Alkalilimnicola ehrlichii]ABI56749.1 D-isomer specific 2-hydroxyacid dehydrogenase, NAD-binding protein [Alkalilimnicola ehrlichii MLHE-1]
MRSAFLDRDSLDQGDLDLAPLEQALPDLRHYERTGAHEVADRIADLNAVVVNKVVLDEAALAAAPDLRLILVAATGTNNVDLAAARQRGITVCNCRGYGTDAVAQHTLGLMLALSTRLLDYHNAVQAGEWGRSEQFCLLDYPIQELSGRTLGLVGHGELGQRVAELARALGMTVKVAARPGGGPPALGRVPLEQLLPQVDVLTLHCPLTDATRNLIGAEALQRLPRHALLINCARGGIVDEQALADALRAGEIGGAGVDVLSEEPPVNGNPLLAGDIPNLIVTPHSAWGSREARQRIVMQLAEAARGYLDGHPVRVVSE